MLATFVPIAVIFILATALGFLVVGLGHAFGPHRPSERKGMPYESGMKPYGPGTRRVPVRFYLVAVLFILFDIEIIFFLPWGVILSSFVKIGLGIFALVEMAIFIVILLVGYVYAWKKGALEWE
ncbi:MAG: NADH-quinone oxidoreductase subunit A [Chloroflexi bacterium RBG_19FT_COMBO_56_12]|nr:MAG: NADH-quinone oxidoreductase subunit A [Chloroflexi bacterium RBG_16_58_14]OGO69767.1 MAG: NADH-quinone oxidoreductase subunit A [Chloroflexi bacterium RBG_19FT_COMBO_56_12]